MPKKVVKDTTNASTSVDTPVPKKTKSKKEQELTPAPTPTPTPTPTSNEVVLEDTDTPLTPSKKKRVVPSRETILAGFDELIEILESEINQLRDSSVKNTNIKVIRLINKKIKDLRLQSTRVMKQKSSTPRQNNHNSGFQKPVRLSTQLAKFTGWPEDELRSRVDVTKYICDYIAANNLQNPEDKRQIWPDAKLQKLLGYNPSKDKTLYYYGIQTYLKNQNHFPKDEK
jgi:chromatin remodeling complex protein RSC6